VYTACALSSLYTARFNYKRISQGPLQMAILDKIFSRKGAFDVLSNKHKSEVDKKMLCQKSLKLFCYH